MHMHVHMCMYGTTLYTKMSDGLPSLFIFRHSESRVLCLLLGVFWTEQLLLSMPTPSRKAPKLEPKLAELFT